MLRPSQDTHRHHPVWVALSDLFLDTEITDSDIVRIAGVLTESCYSDDELANIFWGEVFPACICNLRCIAGEWAGLSEEWLQKRIFANEPKFWLRWRLCQADRFLVDAEWRKVASLVREKRGSGISGRYNSGYEPS